MGRIRREDTPWKAGLILILPLSLCVCVSHSPVHSNTPPPQKKKSCAFTVPVFFFLLARCGLAVGTRTCNGGTETDRRWRRSRRETSCSGHGVLGCCSATELTRTREGRIGHRLQDMLCYW